MENQTSKKHTVQQLSEMPLKHRTTTPHKNEEHNAKKGSKTKNEGPSTAEYGFTFETRLSL
jgi:hypothetical protein